MAKIYLATPTALAAAFALAICVSARPPQQTHSNASANSQASATAGKSSAGLSSGTTLSATLNTNLDAKKNKAGDRVEARTTEDVKQDGRVVLPRGTRLIGHVTEAKAKGKDSAQSSLGVAFDQAIVKKGEEVPVQISIQALAAPQLNMSSGLPSEDMTYSPSPMSGPAGANGGRGMVGSTVNGTTQTVADMNRQAQATLQTAANATSAIQTSGGLDAAGRLAPSSTGIINMSGLSLSSDFSNASQGSLITSTSRNVHLESGTQLVLRVVGQ